MNVSLKNELRVAIVIPTLNRADLVRRQLEYYIATKSIHPVYIGDSSEGEELKKLQKYINELQGSAFKVSYFHYPKTSDGLVTEKLLEYVQEEYLTICGDDDFQIPQGLTKCAEFLSVDTKHEYASCTGKSILFSIFDNATYGFVSAVSEYERRDILADSASERLAQFLEKYYSCVFNVHRTADFKKVFSNMSSIPDRSWTELYSTSMSVILGKAKVLNDCYSIIRYDHIGRYIVDALHKRFVTNNFLNSAIFYKNHLSSVIAQIDNISLPQATQAVEEALSKYYYYAFRVTTQKNRPSLTIAIKEKIKQFLPQQTVSRSQEGKIFFSDPELLFLKRFIENSP